MPLHDFIFSNHRPVRILRHFVFWLGWWLYFFGTRYFYPKAMLPGHTAISKIREDNLQNTFRNYPDYLGGTFIWDMAEFVRSLLMVSIHITACYVVIYFLLPRFLIKGKYFLLLVGIILLGCLMIVASRFMDTIVMHAIFQPDDYTNAPYFSSIFSGVISAIKILAAATAIKLGIYWWKKQKEKEQLERAKITAELQLLKAQIRPAFLFNVLDNIYTYSLIASPVAPKMLIKLSDLLSYMLYECDQTFVPLEKEIYMMKEYIALEKIRLKDAIEIELSVIGDLRGKMIAPFLLLPFIENSFKQRAGLADPPWINMDITVEGNSLCMKLASGLSEEQSGMGIPPENALARVQKRLSLLYPQKHELKISTEPEMLIIVLKIQGVDEKIFESEKDEKLLVSEPAFS